MPFAVGRKGDAGLGFAQRLQLDHLAGQVEDGGLDLVLLVLPAGAAELGQLRIGSGAADVFLHQIDLRRRHIDARAARGIRGSGAPRSGRSSPAPACRDSGRCRGQMDDEVALGKIEKAVDGPRFELAARQDGADFLPVEKLVVAQHQNGGR